jgi:hypothetical protein
MVNLALNVLLQPPPNFDVFTAATSLEWGMEEWHKFEHIVLYSSSISIFLTQKHYVERIYFTK